MLYKRPSGGQALAQLVQRFKIINGIDKRNVPVIQPGTLELSNAPRVSILVVEFLVVD